MIRREIIRAGIFFLFVILMINFIFAYTSSNYGTIVGTSASAQTFDQSTCSSGTDFLVQIAPVGCTPTVVRSDLLEQQDVPVFCQLSATQINPLINVAAINNIVFNGTTSTNLISGVGFWPADSALSSSGNPILDNIGYVKIVLKQQRNESSMPDYVYGNLTANINYDLQDSLGIGTASLYLPQMSDSQWQANSPEFGFWNGQGFLRATNVQTGQATISVYDNTLAQVSNFNINVGATSNKIYIPGLNCLSGFSVKLNSVENPDTRAILKVNADTFQVAKGEYFLNNKCQVQSIDKKGLSQSVGVLCSEDQNGFYNGKPFTLTISPKIKLSFNGNTGEYGLGDYLYTDTKANPNEYVYLGYIGTQKDSYQKSDLFAYLLETPTQEQNLTNSELSSVSNMVDNAITQNSGILQKAESALQTVSTSTENFLSGKSIKLLKTGTPVSFGGQSAVSLIDFASPSDLQITASQFTTNFNGAVSDYNNVINSFPTEQYSDDTISISSMGENALVNEIKLMDSTSQKKTLADLCSKLQQSYPDSKSLTLCSNSYNLASSEASSADVLVNGKTEQISFSGIYQPSTADYGAKILITGTGAKGGTFSYEETLPKDSVVYLKDLGFADNGEFVQLTNLDDSSATLKINLVKKGTSGGVVASGNNKITINSPQTFGSDDTFTLEAVNLNKVASVSVIPNIGTTGSTANFQFKIGIDKVLNITLIPAAMKTEILALNNSISTLQNISSGLYNFAQAGKTACLATGAVLVAKNFLEAFNGDAIARATVMEGKGGWNQICAAKVKAGTSPSLDRCFLDNADQINNDVSTLSGLITTQNQNIENLQPAVTNALGQKSVDSNALGTKLCTQDATNINSVGKLTDSSGLNPINLQSMQTVLSNLKDADTCRDIQLYMSVLSSGASDELKAIASQSLYSDLFDLQKSNANSVARLSTANSLGIDSSKIGVYTSGTEKIQYLGLTYANINNKITLPGVSDPATPIQLEQYDNSVYIVVLDNSAGNNMPIKTIQTKTSIPTGSNYVGEFMIYDLNGNLISNPEAEIPDLDKIYFVNINGYNNQYKNYKISFYDTDPYKGMPAIVPFDINNGWYAATTQTLPVLGNLKAYDASGKVSSFWVCNVGPNGLEENRGGDDICEQINLNTGQPLNQFPGITNTQEASNRITAAENAIQQAGTQKGQNIITINVGYGAITFNQNKISTAANIPDVQCQDFMSPSDCAVLFNVCDPFICPSSRCNLGGAYTVPDVVQSGIIGSIALCFPNFIGLGGTDILPVCMTGIQAGIDSFISVQKSYRDCLQDSLNTGSVRGICDEIHGMYLCDFFWKQAAPFAQALLPNIISTLSGQVKGGGEYLTINSAFDNAQKSANYFVQYYGANAGTAFSTRTAEQFIGDAICKTSSSVVYPSSADLLSSITKPSSPPQFTGRFQEESFTSVTNPPLSQYTVYYHIFAGNDAGASYQVYLRGTGSSINVVASGYAPAGESADDTRVFTAVSGYKELCISVNGQEQCGFQEASTSFGVNYVQQSYVASQVNNSNIQTTAQCNSGTIPISGEELYNQGITRICATDNPGQGTDPYIGLQNQRWVEVGYCDTQNIKCWLDTSSISNAITIGTIKNQTANDIQAMLQSQGGYLTSDQFSTEISNIEKEESNPSQEIIDINKIYANIFYNNEKGYATLLRGDAYSALAILNKPAENVNTATTATQTPTPEQTIKSYKLSLGFQFNGDSPNYISGITKSSTDTVLLTVKPQEAPITTVKDESSCDRVQYRVFQTNQNVISKVWNFISNPFKGNGLGSSDEPKSSYIDYDGVNALISILTQGTYYVTGYCYSTKGQTGSYQSKNLIVQEGAGAGTIPVLETRYTEFQNYFDQYSQNFPGGWNQNSFKALLVAIAQRQSNLGYPSGSYDPRWIMEYGWENGQRMDAYACDFSSIPYGEDKPTYINTCINNQIRDAAKTLKDALNADTQNEIQTYQECNSLNTNINDPTKDDRLNCVLRVYMTGINGATSQQGAEAATEVIQYMLGWEKYFSTGDTGSLSQNSQ
ncbi:MAG TPA: hypothetical protein VMC80_00885 [Patescibacteria group bacterium]|nr:hypothetical protein [Patescibacteria group bacterium]